MKFEKLNLFLNKIKQGRKGFSPEERVSEEYQRVKKELRPLKTTKSFRPGDGDNRDISAI